MSNLKEIDQADVMILKFPGRCSNDKCRASNTMDASLTFGSGLWDFQNQGWEFPCAVCNDAWRKFAGNYIFDLVITAQRFLIQNDLSLRDTSIELDQGDLDQIKRAARPLALLSPFEVYIRTGVSWAFGAIGLVTTLDDISKSYYTKIAEREAAQLSS